MRGKRAALVALLSGVLIGGCNPRTPAQALRKVDSRLYYPQRLGLRKLTAKVDCPHLDEHFTKKSRERADSAAYLQPMLPLRIQFSWDPESGGRYDYQSVPPSEKELRNFLDLAFKGTEILVVPPTEVENFRSFDATFGPWQENYRIIGVNREPHSEFTQYSVVVDRNFKVISRQYFAKDYVSTTVPTYREEGGQWLVTDLVTHQLGTTTDKHVISEVHLTYQQVQGLWLVKSLEYVFREKMKVKDENNQDQERVFKGPLVIVYSDYQIEK